MARRKTPLPVAGEDSQSSMFESMGFKSIEPLQNDKGYTKQQIHEAELISRAEQNVLIAARRLAKKELLRISEERDRVNELNSLIESKGAGYSTTHAPLVLAHRKYAKTMLDTNIPPNASKHNLHLPLPHPYRLSRIRFSPKVNHFGC